MPDDAQNRKDLLDLLRSEHGSVPGWVTDVLPLVRFNLVAGFGASKYKGGVVTCASDAMNRRRLPELIHELWHAFLDLIVNEKGGNAFGQKTRRMFAETKRQVEARYQFDFTPELHSDYNGPRRLWRYYAGSDTEDMSDELWGNYIQATIEAAVTIGSTARFTEEAQVLWNGWLAENGEARKLNSEYTKKANRLYNLGDDVAAFIRKDLLKLGPTVRQWPSGYRGWEKTERQLGSVIVNALQGADAHRSDNARAVLEEFLGWFLCTDPNLKRALVALGNPEVEVRNTTSGRDLGLRVQGGRKVLVFPQSLASAGEMGAARFTRIDFVNLSNALPAILGLKK
jgi:hypothetical protein